ncbi:hypothetical protein [Pseudomarimonas arenosa]|uniref:PAS domain-containing protein n=1 Tax=Pseudomarimonas arenosa TaxID=2774145 RepID=A0AAW3ZTM2_9GAMM|nr:hypothetical protein [Pseudomarimonas arenosa]MBD8527864.1 hypothetical protein [Pseudomarimonas arenosa]
MDISSLFPIIVPRSYNRNGRWLGPLQLLAHPQLAVTWVLLCDDASMTYVNHAMARELTESGIDFVAEAMSNLRSASEGCLYTHVNRTESGISFVASMQEDGLGSSRLLLVNEWRNEFPNGFLFGIPERSCAIVVSATCTAAESEHAAQAVKGCYSEGNTQMLPGLHAPELFVPELVEPGGQLRIRADRGESSWCFLIRYRATAAQYGVRRVQDDVS